MQHNDIAYYILQFSYFGIFLWFAVIEQLTPIPEEVYLMSAGYIAIHAHMNIVFCGVAAVAGLLVTDNLLFYFAFKGNKFSQKLLKKINHELLDKIKVRLQKKAAITIFIGALVPKLRFFNPLIAGSINIKFRIFFFANALATALYVVVYMSIGILFHRQLNFILKKLDFLQHGVFIGVMIVIALFLIIKMSKLILEKNKPKKYT
jgi:membrane protein DedA with SNARE-associated domain